MLALRARLHELLPPPAVVEDSVVEVSAPIEAPTAPAVIPSVEASGPPALAVNADGSIATPQPRVVGTPSMAHATATVERPVEPAPDMSQVFYSKADPDFHLRRDGSFRYVPDIERIPPKVATKEILNWNWEQMLRSQALRTGHGDVMTDVMVGDVVRYAQDLVAGLHKYDELQAAITSLEVQVHTGDAIHREVATHHLERLQGEQAAVVVNLAGRVRKLETFYGFRMLSSPKTPENVRPSMQRIFEILAAHRAAS